MTPACINCLVGLALFFLMMALITWVVFRYIIRHAPLSTQDNEHGFVIVEEPLGANPRGEPDKKGRQ